VITVRVTTLPRTMRRRTAWIHSNYWCCP